MPTIPSPNPNIHSHRFGLALLFALLLAACSDQNHQGPGRPSHGTGAFDGTVSASSSASTGPGGAGGGNAKPLPNPFDTEKQPSFGMVDLSHNLEEVLEYGQLPGSCTKYNDNPGDARLERMCGKEKFFYDPMETVGVPRPLVDYLLKQVPDLVGPGFSAYGLIPDPYSPDGLPLGMAPSANNSVAFTCASCHFARLPDGRYAVGAPNDDYDYGGHNLALTLVPMSLLGTGNMDDLALAKVQPILDRLDQDLGLKFQLMMTLLQLLGNDIPSFPKAAQRLYARWKPGTMDFLIAPLPLDDGVHTISRIPGLWGLPTSAQQSQAGMKHALLGWTGNTPSTADFVYWFGVLGGGRTPTQDDIKPMVRYLESLAAPDAPSSAHPETEQEKLGHEVFARDCLGCHGGPNGSGVGHYSFAAIGTDSALALWMNPQGDKKPCCNETLPEDFITGMLKSPRLLGLWGQQRFLHNGSVESLKALFCLEPREQVTESAFADSGHSYGCELPEAERKALIAWLKRH